MKNGYLLSALLLTGAILASCNSSSKLTDNIDGTWSSVPENVVYNDSISIEIIKTFEFAPTDNDSGTVIISGMISMERIVPPNEYDSLSIINPLTVTAAAVASVQGTFEAVSHDRIELKLAPSTYSFKLDDEAVYYDYNLLTAGATPEPGVLKPAFAEFFRHNASEPVRKALLGTEKITHINFHDGMAACNINGLDITLRKQLSTD